MLVICQAIEICCMPMKYFSFQKKIKQTRLYNASTVIHLPFTFAIQLERRKYSIFTFEQYIYICTSPLHIFSYV